MLTQTLTPEQTDHVVPALQPAGTNEPPRDPPAAASEAESDDQHTAVVRILNEHNIPGLFWPCFFRYLETGRIIGGEFRIRLATLTHFRDCLKALRELTRQDYPTLNGIDSYQR